MNTTHPPPPIIKALARLHSPQLFIIGIDLSCLTEMDPVAFKPAKEFEETYSSLEELGRYKSKTSIRTCTY